MLTDDDVTFTEIIVSLFEGDFSLRTALCLIDVGVSEEQWLAHFHVSLGRNRGR